jgi:hypothetical protein
MQPWGAGGHHNPIQSLFSDVLLDKLLAGIRTHIGIYTRNSNTLQILRPISYSLTIHSIRNVQTTLANIDPYANFLIMGSQSLCNTHGTTSYKLKSEIPITKLKILCPDTGF